MKIVLFHPTHLPPKDYGGVERVVLWLTKGLLELGHEVWVAAFPGSRLPRGAQRLEVSPEKPTALELPARLPPGTDVVHFQAPPEEGVWKQLPCAGLVTVHGNGKPGEVFPKNSVFLTRDHATRHSATAFVFNGIDPDEYLFRPELKSDRYLFLSKTSWKVKNVKGAIDLCSRARVGLDIAGGYRPWSQRIGVALSEPRMSWLGPVAGARKAELLSRASALIFPVIWPEPFGLVVAEAMMSGTPVLASPIGSLPELIPPDVGALPRDSHEWLTTLREGASKWSPEGCRAWAMEQFHYRRMAFEYVEYYRKAMSGFPLHEAHPEAKGWRQQIP